MTLEKLEFVPLHVRDLQLLHRWLGRDPVLTWYARRPLTLEEVTASHLPTVEGTEPTRGFVLRVAGVAAGFWKTYRIEDYPGYARVIGAEPGWAGMDFLIGEDRFRGIGLAPSAHKVFLEQVMFADPRVTACVSGPDPANTASVRSLERAGFRRLRIVETDPGVRELLMLRARKQSPPGGFTTR